MDYSKLKPGIYITNGNAIKSLTAENAGVLIDGGFSDASKVESIAETVPWLYACYNKRADTLIGIPRKIVNSAGKEVPEDELPFTINLDDLLWRTEYALNVYAKAYLYKHRRGVTGRGVIQSVRWFDPNTISYKVDSLAGLSKFERELNGSKLTFPVKNGISPQIVYFWLPGMREAAPGVAPSDVLQASASVLQLVDKMADQFFSNGAMPITLLLVPPGTPDQEKKRVETRFKKLSQGWKNFSNVVAMRAPNQKGQGGVEAKVIGFPLKDLALKELTQAKHDEITAVTGVPQSMIIGNAANYATAERDAKNFVENIIGPRLRLFRNVLNKQLFSEVGLMIEFHPELLPVMQQDEKAASIAFRNYTTGGMTPEGAAWKLGISTEKAPDDIALFAEPEPVPDESVPTPESSSNTTAKSDDLAKWRRKAKKAIKRGESASVKFDSDELSATEIKTIADLLSYTNSIEEVDAVFDGYPFSEFKTTPSDPRYKVERSLKRKLLENFKIEYKRTIAKAKRGEIHTPDVTALRNALVEDIQKAAIVGAEKGTAPLIAFGLGFDEAAINHAAVAWARTHISTAYDKGLAEAINATTIKHIQEAVGDWLQNDSKEPVQTLIDRLAGTFGAKRAETIAVTEVTEAINGSAIESWRQVNKQLGIEVVKGKKWYTANDERVCPVCSALGGLEWTESGADPASIETQDKKALEVGLDENFVHPGGKGLQAKFEGQTYRRPPAHPGCRCEVLPVL